jgi:hypothetical protein
MRDDLPSDPVTFLFTDVEVSWRPGPTIAPPRSVDAAELGDHDDG